MTDVDEAGPRRGRSIQRWASVACAALAVSLIPLAYAGRQTSRVLSSWWWVVLALVAVSLVLAWKSRRGFVSGPGTFAEARARKVAIAATSFILVLVASGFVGWFLVLSWAGSRTIEGRQLRRRVGARSAAHVVEGADAATSSGSGIDADVHLAVDGFRPVEVAALGQRWSRSAEGEFESVATFRQIGLELTAIGAPAELVARARRAVHEEAIHTTRCRRLSDSFVSGERAEPNRRRMHRVKAASTRPLLPRSYRLVRLAVESLVDGCFGEGVAGLEMAQRAEHCDAAVRDHLLSTAADELGHAELAWAIVEWAVAEGGAPVTSALTRAARALPESLEADAIPHGCRRDVLVRNGWDDPAARAWAAARVRRDLLTRLASLTANPTPNR